MRGNTYLQDLNLIQQSLDGELKEFEKMFCNDVDIDLYQVNFETDTYPALGGDSIHIHITISDMDLWSKYWHTRLCTEFNVHLWDYRIKYSFAEQYFGCERTFTYIYAPNDEGDYSGKLFEDRLDDFFYKPRELENNQYWNMGDKTRILVHRILNKLRECDNLDLDYEDYINKDCLFVVSEQLDCCLKHKDKLTR